MARRTQQKRSGKGKVRYAVVGLGHIAQVAVLPAFGMRAATRCSPRWSATTRRSSGSCRGNTAFRSYSDEQYQECLEQVDAVYIALPNAHARRGHHPRGAGGCPRAVRKADGGDRRRMRADDRGLRVELA